MPYLFAGLADSVNPCALASLAVFVLLLAYVPDTERKMFWLGSGFIMAVGMGWLANIIVGRFDPVLVLPGMLAVFKFFYLGLGLVFIFAGVLNLRDWLEFVKTRDFKRFTVRLPRMIEGHLNIAPKISRETKFVRLKFAGLGSLTGFCLTFLSSLWPPHETVAVMLYQYSLPGQIFPAVTMSFFYGLGYVFPLVTALSIFLILRRLNPPPSINNIISKIKIISAAVFLALGAGLTVVFLN